MFKRTTTKIFVAFTLIVLAQTIGLSYFYGRVILRESENFALESLSRRTQLQATEIASDIKQGLSVEQLKIKGHRFVSTTGDASNLETQFSAAELKSLLPSSGSVVSVCQSASLDPFYCSLSAIGAANLWAIDIAPRMTLTAVIRSLRRELLTTVGAALAFSLFVTFIISQILLRPLRQFSKASQSVASGHYDDLHLPIARADEIGDFARAFNRMIDDLKERERNIAISSIKISHSSRLASLGQMGASIAHEVKNPLTSMIGYAKVLKAKLSEPQLQEAADIIQHEGERCNQILQQMLRFARNDPDQSRPYSLGEVIQSCLLLLKSEAKTSQHQLINEMAGDHILIGSPQQIQQVIINLIMNAMQASPKGSVVRIGSKIEGGWLQISVEDQGGGIPKAIQNRIFDPFFTTKKETDGTGLGLSVAREIVHDQGGDLSFTTTEGKGTVFTIKLPLPKEEIRASS